MNIVLVFAACYFFGSIPFGLLAGLLIKGIDIRKYGSSNIGATNVLRTLGPTVAAVVFLLDTFKGLGAVLLCQAMVPDKPLVTVAGALLSVAGHTFSVFLKFKGGKGVATSLGVILGFNWIIGLVALGVWVVCLAISKYVSFSSIVAAASVPLMMEFWSAQQVPAAYTLTAVAAALAVVLKHIPNIKRLLSGTEPRIGQKVQTATGDSVDNTQESSG